jgi:small subunit ribosomal protein S6
MWLLGAEADADAGAASVDKVTAWIKDGGGKVSSAALWGRRTLSYEVANNREGTYFLANFSLDSAATQTLEQAITADQEIIRHVLIRHDKPVPMVEENDEGEERRGGGGRRPRRA